MNETLRPLILDLVGFVAERPRPYAEVLDAWRTSCPRLTVWEDAVEGGLVVVEGGMVRATEAGLAAAGREGATGTAPHRARGAAELLA